jgi:quercetin dioxygenase-like cupin family protein
MKHILQAADGEALKLGPPAAGEIRIKVDSRAAGGLFAVGTETLLPGSAIPMHRHLERETVLWVHKGQGRATVEGEAMTVVPGAMIYVPRQSWHGLRNTGNGPLQIAWFSTPPGLEEFFRDYSKLGGQADAAALQELARRHGIEFRPEGQSPAAPAAPAAAPQRRGRRRHRGGRGRRSGSPRTPQEPSKPQPPQAKPQPESRPSPAPSTPRPPEAGVSRPKPRREPRPEGRSDRRGGGHRRSGRVKEVYMGGKWVRVVGEGPVISGE